MSSSRPLHSVAHAQVASHEGGAERAGAPFVMARRASRRAQARAEAGRRLRCPLRPSPDPHRGARRRWPSATGDARSAPLRRGPLDDLAQRTLTISTEDFLRLFLQHVQPKRFPHLLLRMAAGRKRRDFLSVATSSTSAAGDRKIARFTAAEMYFAGKVYSLYSS